MIYNGKILKFKEEIMKKLLSVMLILALVFCFAACGNDGGSTEPAAEEEVVLVIGNVPADTHPYSMALHMANDLLAEAGSTVSLDVQVAGILGSETEMAQNVQLGVLDCAETADMSTTGVAPAMAFSNLPGLFADYDGVKAAWAPDGFCYVAADQILADAGVKLLAAGDNGFRVISNSVRPIEKIEDIAGLKIRVPENELLLEIWGKMGAVTCPIAYGELAAALQQKTVDGQELYSSFYTMRMDEFQPYLTLLNYDYSAVLMYMNMDKFNSLTENQQTQLLDAFAEAAQWNIDYTANYYEEGLKVMIDEGLQCLDATPEMVDYFIAMGDEIAHEQKWTDLFGESIVNQLYPQ